MKKIIHIIFIHFSEEIKFEPSNENIKSNENKYFILISVSEF